MKSRYTTTFPLLPPWDNLSTALRSGLAVLLDWRPLLLVGIYLLLTLLATQVPFSYSFIAGNQRGIQSDLPFLWNFNAAEASDEMGRWRWSRAEADMVVPGVGTRPLLIEMNIMSHRGQWEPEEAPTVLIFELDGSTDTPIMLRPEGAHYQLYIPASALDDGNLRLGLETEPWQHPTDRRDNLGVAIGEQVTLTSLPTDGLVLPASGLLLLWPLGLVLFWLSLRVLTFSPNQALWLLLPLAVALPALLPLAAPRIAYGNPWVVQAGIISLGAALVCVLSVPPLLEKLRVPAPPELLRWLLLLVVLTFVIAYAGRLYIASMPGDLQLHVNRYLLTVFGDVYIRAQHRGLPFPFPNGMYVLMAPLHLSGSSIHFLFELVVGLMEATAVLLMYLLMTRVSGTPRLGLLAAATYALTAGGFMVTWFAFATQVAAQWFTVLLVTVLAFTWPQRRDWLTWAVVVMLLIQIFLAHIGQFINLSLVGLLLVPLLWWRADSEEERAGALWIGGAGLAAGLFVAVFYYTAFWDLIWEQIRGIATVGLNEVTERPPIPRAETLRVTWEGGLIRHFGFFPVLLAIPGALAMAAPRLRRSIVPPLVWLSFLVSISQGILPLITLNSITTRWLMFSSWAIAAAGAWGLWLLWRHGRAARVVALAMAAYVTWITIEVWMNAMLLRLPPIEPF